MHIIYRVDSERLERDREAYRQYVIQQYVLFVTIPLFSVLAAVFIWYMLNVFGFVS